MQIYNHVSLAFPNDIPTIATEPLRIGDLLNVVLKVKTSFQWASEADLASLQATSFDAEGGEKKHRMMYDVITKSDDWIVAQGRKKGEFLVTLPDSTPEENEISVPLTLAPLRQGKLFLPSIAVTPLAPDRSTTGSLPSCEVNNVSAGISIDVLEAMDAGIEEDGEEGLGRTSFWIDRGTGESGLISV
jgi:hypothetical protein